MVRNVYGYIRVSTKEQNEDRQWLAMKEYGVPEGNVYVDKQSGKDFDRPGYRQVLEVLCENDVLVIKSIDRLGRHFDELLEQWRIITVEKKAGIIVLDLPILNVGLENDLLGKEVAQLMLTRLKGVHLGRRPKEIPEEFENVKTLWEEGECSATAAARRLGVDFHTFKKWVATCMGEESVGEENRISNENV